MNDNPYRIQNAADVPSPALLYYPDIIRENTQKAIDMAGDAGRLWPHVKTHKSEQITRIQVAAGIVRFKCATFSEAEMVARCGAQALLLAYPLVGPNIARFVALAKAYPHVECFALADDLRQLASLGAHALAEGLEAVHVLLDINLGMNRTGIAPEAAHAWYRAACEIPGVRMRGLHCYDGHRHERNAAARLGAVEASLRAVDALRAHLSADGMPCDVLIMGGTPSFPCHATRPGVYLSPGTCFVMDYGYARDFPDLPFAPGAAVLTRVISRPAPGTFTLDLGCKGIASDPAGARGVIVGWPEAKPLFQSEEHWVFALEPDAKRPAPETGAELYVIPTHICPTTALYPEVTVVQNGRATGTWAVTARDRRLSI